MIHAAAAMILAALLVGCTVGPAATTAPAPAPAPRFDRARSTSNTIDNARS